MTTEIHSTPEGNHQAALVLHVDDDENDIVLMRAAARRAGVPIRLENAPDGEHAIRYLSALAGTPDLNPEGMPRLILVDLKLPRATGLQILQWVRSNPSTSHIPVVVLSGSEHHADMQKAYEAGANSYVVKPVGFEPLVRLMNRLSRLWCRKPAHET